MAALPQSAGLEHLSLAGLPAPIVLRLAVPLSDEELISFSRRNRPYRVERNENGDLEIMTPVDLEGGQRELRVVARLSLWAEQHGGVAFSSSAGFTLHDGSVRSPDASWLSDARWNALTPQQQEGFGPVCPEFLIEVLSKTDSRVALESKMQLWIASGARLAWMIDPFARTLTIYTPGRPPQVLEQPEAVVAEEVVPGFRLEMGKLWSR